MRFINISIGANQVNEPAWQKKVREEIERDYEAQAVEAGVLFAKKYNEILKHTGPGFEATAAVEVMTKIPRYTYIKHVEGKSGDTYEVEIDLLLHTVHFLEEF